ncbi:MAG: suppressor of fused domain protein [Planctomycetota bacterium]
MEEGEIRSPGGSRICLHRERVLPFIQTSGDARRIAAIAKHIEAHVGCVSHVFHELVSDLVHVDIHVVTPTRRRPWNTLITSGMSEVTMTVPQCSIPGGVIPRGTNPRGPIPGGARRDGAYAELCIALPHHWPVGLAALRRDVTAWPILYLVELARFPHLYDTSLGFGHSITNGNPPCPLAPGVGFVGAVILPPVGLPSAFCELRVSPNVLINFYGVYPIYQDEMDFLLQNGIDAIMERFAACGVTELLDVKRKSVCGRR